MNLDKKMKNIKPSVGNGYILCVVLLEIISGIVLGILIDKELIKIGIDSPYLQILNQLIVFGIPFLIYILIYKKNIVDVLSIKKIKLTNIMLIFIMCFLIQPFMMSLSGLSSLFFENNIDSTLESYTSLPFMLLTLTMAITPAIMEEITLRGVLQYNYKNVSLLQAALVNGLFFGIIHLDLQQFLYAFIIGILFSAIVRYTRSIFSSMIAHFTINFSQLCMFLFLGIDEKNSELQGLDLLKDKMYVDSMILLIIMTIISVPFFIFVFKLFINYNRRINLIEDIEKAEITETTEITETSKGTTKIITWQFICLMCLFTLFSLLIVASKYI